MPSHNPGVKELGSRIGLRGICTAKKGDMSAHPTLQLFWEKVSELCKSQYMRSCEDIREAEDIQRAALEMFDAYAPELWERPTHGETRGWLYSPGEGWAACSRYTRDLFYDSQSDREFLRTTLIELIIERILNHHKRHYRQSLRYSSEASFGPDASLAGSSFQCFGSGIPITNHQDATWLNEQGIWLGSYDEEKEQVNGMSFEELSSKYFDDTTGGTQTTGVEPQVFDPEVFDRSEGPVAMTVQCKACATKGQSTALTAEMWGFEWSESDTATHMSFSVWTYPCYLHGKKVFAILKPVPEYELKRLESANLWQFWLIDGGYTKTSFLAQTQTPVAPSHNAGATASIQQTERPQYARKSAPAIGAIGGKGKKRTREYNSTNKAEELFRSIRKQTLEHSDGSRSPPKGGNDWDSMYDVTPRPGLETTSETAERMTIRPASSVHRARGVEVGIGLGRQGTAQAQQTVSLFARAAAPSSTSTRALPRAPSLTSPPPYEPVVRFELWIRSAAIKGVKIVVLSDRLAVEDVFAAVHRKMGKKLSGSESTEIIGILVEIPGENDPICVEHDGADEWGAVLRSVKDSGLVKLYGTVECGV
ncbi:hypothetical protein TI39_contig4195g00009 [Zymoseptoria brevis]|uniref:Uncharacterized protein n=1 Tax=Zymoseptoria brevis TaxID=1047168 RepID=A0A0F4GAN5_9PEZI|nr:hypothetical protein TI39_contig4195g00009 [Zymoseptoria brevis]